MKTLKNLTAVLSALNKSALVFFVSIILGNLCSAYAANYKAILIESENFAVKTGWTVETFRSHYSQSLQTPSESTANASTIITAPAAGDYYVWVSNYEFDQPEEQYPRYVGVYINGTKLPVSSYGQLGGSTWRWLRLGQVTLTGGDTLVALDPESGYVHCDAVFFTQDPNFDPNEKFLTQADRTAYYPSYKNVLTEAESFVNYADWTLETKTNETQTNVSAQTFLIQKNYNTNSRPSVKINAPKEGYYILWSSSYEFDPALQYARYYNIYINDVNVGRAYQNLGGTMWKWMNMGRVYLPKGFSEIKLQSLVGWVRCDALFFTEDPYFDPNASLMTTAQRTSYLPQYTSVLFEAENFAAINQWQAETFDSQSAIAPTAVDSNANASVKFNVKSEGKYDVWICEYSSDAGFANGELGCEVFVDKVSLGSAGTSAVAAGSSLKWLKVGVVDLQKGVSEIAVKASSLNVKVDALFITQNPNANPSTMLATAANRTSYVPTYQTFTVNAADITSRGSWSLSTYQNAQCLYASAVDTTTNLPTQSVTSPKAADYHVWACVYEFNMNTQQSPRIIQVSVNASALEKNAYRQLGGNAWLWSKLDTVTLPQGSFTLTLKALAGYSRLAAITFTEDPNYNPNASDNRNSSALPTQNFLVESEDFQFHADWIAQEVVDDVDGLFTIDAQMNPFTSVSVVKAGVYNVWANSRDFATDRPGTRLYSVIVDGVEMPIDAGQHGFDGLYWEMLGSIYLPAGEHIVALKRETAYCRSDAILLSENSSFNPNTAIAATPTLKASMRRAVTPLEYEVISSFPSTFQLFTPTNASTVSAQNSVIKIEYVRKKSSAAQYVWVRRTYLYKDGAWVLAGEFDDEKLFMSYSAAIGRSETPFFSMWSGSQMKLIVNSTVYNYSDSGMNPYEAAQAAILTPTSVTSLSATSLRVDYSNGAYALVELNKPGKPLAKMTLYFTAGDAGYYSAGFLGFDKHAKSDVTAVEMPSMFQLKRMMESAKQVTNNFMSQPMVLLETLSGSSPCVNGIVADPAKLPFEWTNATNSVYGFSMISSDRSSAQAAVFMPVLAGRNSQKSAGEAFECSWYLLSLFGDWRDGVEMADENIFDVSRLREPTTVSLSDALCNIATYMKSSACGWSAKNKARYNIEAVNTATQASPLSDVSVALLTNDEDYYVERSLPTIEFTISRNSPHFSYADGSYGSSSMALIVPSGSWGGDYYSSLNGLLGNANTWMESFYWTASGYGNLRKGSNSVPEWAALLAIYMTNPNSALLTQIESLCDSWITSSYTTGNVEPNMESFVNVSTYPYWWPLIDLYEITGEARYLEAAEKGAFYTLSCLWAYPTPPEGNVTIYPNNTVTGIGTVWWKGYDLFRLGYDTNKEQLRTYLGITQAELANYRSTYYMPAKTVPAMKVSRIGLGIEQHTTYPAGTTNSRNIEMPSWAPELLKVYQYSGRDVIFKFSRHAIIGRYANFFGYYIQDFSDIHQDENYPYAGPDLTSFYYHHAACHFGHTMDYLMSSIELRTNNAVRFPFVRQGGYVWFTDRIFGLRGTVFTDTNCRLMIDKEAVRPNTPNVSVVYARASNGLWVFLINDSGSEVQTPLTYDFDAPAMDGVYSTGSASIYNASGTYTGAIAIGSANSVTIPALGLIALKLSAASETYTAPSALSSSDHRTISAVGGNLGDFHAFRIRGPFGKDSFYGVFTGSGHSGQTATLTLQVGDAYHVIVADSYPFEFSYYGIDFDDEIALSVTVAESGQTDIVIGDDLNLTPSWVGGYAASAAEDIDGDAYTGTEEYVLGTDAASAASRFRMDIAPNALGQNVIIFSAREGRLYKILWSDDMKTWQTFADGGEIEAFEDGTLSFVDDFGASTTGSAPNGRTGRYYKLEVTF